MPSPRRFRNFRHWWLLLRNNVAAKQGVRRQRGPDSAWRDAIWKNDKKQMKRYFRAGISAKGLVHPLSCGLGRLIDRNDYQALRWVLVRGANPDAKNNNSYRDSLMHRAASQGRNALVRLLAEQGASLEIKDGNGYSPLAVALNGFGEHKGIWENRREVVFSLVKLGAQAKGFTHHDRESFLGLLEELDSEVLQCLLDAGANPRQMFNPTPEEGWEPRDAEPSLLFHGHQWWTTEPQFQEWAERMAQAGLTMAERTQTGASLAWVVLTEKRPSYPDVPEVVAGLKAIGAWDVLPPQDVQDQPRMITFLRACPDHWWAWVDVLLEEPAFKASLHQSNQEGQTVQAWLEEKQWAAGTIYHRQAQRLKEALLDHALPEAMPASLRSKPRF